MTLTRESISRRILIAGLGAIGVGIVIYAANYTQRALILGTLLLGIALVAVWAALNRRLLGSFFSKRSARYGANTLITVAAFLAIVVVVQALSTRYSRTYDLTRNRRFTLAPQTAAVLDSLRRPIDAYAFFKRGTPDEAAARDLLEQFRRRTDRFDFEFVDPDREPRRAREMEVYAFGTTIVECGARSETLTRLSEENLLNALVSVTRDTVKVICFVKGHGEREPSGNERNGYSIAAAALEREGFNVSSLSLFDVASVPPECALVVAAGPKADYLESEVAKIEQYLDAGGRALILIDPDTELPNIEALAARYGISANDDAIVDPYSRVFGGDYSVPVVTEYPDHPITRGFDLATFFPSARSIAVVQPRVEGMNVEPLAKTGKSAWGETNLDLIEKGQAVKSDEDNVGPVALAAISERRLSPSGAAVSADHARRTAVVVFGDSDFAANGSFRLSGNADLFLNVIDYLTEEESLIAIRPRKGLGDRVFLTASQGRFIFLVSVVLVPLAVMTFGTTVWLRRRRRG